MIILACLVLLVFLFPSLPRFLWECIKTSVCGFALTFAFVVIMIVLLAQIGVINP